VNKGDAGTSFHHFGTIRMNPLARDLDHILEHTAPIWAELHDSRIFLTGGTGFFGCWLLESFCQAVDRLGLQASLTVLTRSAESFRRKSPHLASHHAVHMMEGDIRTFGFPAGSFTHVIHGAAASSAALYRDQPLEMLDTIVEGTRRTLQFAASAGAQRFLMLSSGSIYGPQAPGIPLVSEEYRGGPDPTDTRSVYAEGKRVAEWLCCQHARAGGFGCPIARGFAFVGPHLPLDTHFAIGNFIGDCLMGRTIEIRGDGTAYRSYLYTADLAIWLWTILVRGASCQAYNVGSERGLSIADLAASVAAELAPSTGIRVLGVPRPGVPPDRYVPDTTRARVELGLQEWIPLEEAIRRTADWYSASAAKV